MRRINGSTWLTTCALAACLGALLGGRSGTDAQSAGEPAGRYIMTSGSTTDGRTEVYILDVSEHKLGTYQTDQFGVRLRGVRDIRWDLEVEELSPKGQRMSVEAMRKLAQQRQRQKLSANKKGAKKRKTP